LPSLVFESAIVGPVAVLQQTPFSVISSPPSDLIVPPETAEFRVTWVTSTVVNSGTVAFLHPWNAPATAIRHIIDRILKPFFILLFFGLTFHI
jgi:hypothetical protein